MLGEKIGEETGKITAQRVLPGPVPKIETSFKAAGTLLGVSATGIGTYDSTMRPDGTMIGEGSGVVTTKDGGSAFWRGSGVGFAKPDGGISFRGSIVYTTDYSKWARLNQCAVLFEYDVDEEGNTRSREFEWK